MHPARIVFVTGSLAHGGAERLSVTVMNRLAERGHECHAVFVKGTDAALLARLQLPPAATVRCLHARRYFDWRALDAFRAHLAALRPSVIVAANAYALMYAFLARVLSRSPGRLAVTWHSTRLLGAKEELQMVLYRLFFWMSDGLVFVCEKQKRHWLRRGVFSRRNEVIYNGVDTEAFAASAQCEARAATRAALGMRESDYVVGMAAILRPEKNAVQLVDAVAMLRLRGLPARALVIGEGEMRPALEARARALGVEGDVVITGLQQDVRPYMAACDVMVSCSHTEALSLAVIEAMALGKPVVISDVGGAAEMVTPGENGFLFPVGDTPMFVNRLSMLGNKALRRDMGERARCVAERLFSEKTMVDRYERTLLELCAQRRPSPTGP